MSTHPHILDSTRQEGLAGLGKDWYKRWGKRAFDFVAAAIALIFSSPLLVICSLLVRLTSRGPIFFRQVRVGRDGSRFNVLKFRTMKQEAEQEGPAPVVPGDSRLTPVGRFLRGTKIDELPQFINVLLGNMSLVGPRPRVPEEVNLDLPEERALLALRPGITSYASIYHRLEAEFCSRQEDARAAHRLSILPQKSYLDQNYLENMSFWLDVKLLLLTFLLVFVPGKAYPRTVRLFGVNVGFYGERAQMILEALLYTGALWLSYWLRFEDQLPEFNLWQRNAFLLMLPAARVGTNRLMGVYRTIWRYINLTDAFQLSVSLSIVSAVLLSLRLFLPVSVSSAHVFQLPLSIIAMEYLIVTGSCLGLRGLRRALYEMHHRYQPLPAERKRRILIFGAGFSGVELALQVGRYPHMDLVGFVDDDLMKQGRLIAGYSVLGPSERVEDLVRRHDITDLIVCAQTVSRDVLNSISDRCRALSAKVHVVPTIDQILGPRPSGAKQVARRPN